MLLPASQLPSRKRMLPILRQRAGVPMAWLAAICTALLSPARGEATELPAAPTESVAPLATPQPTARPKPPTRELWVRAPRALQHAGQLDSAGPVTVIGGAELRRRYVSAAEALAEQPGLAVMRTGGVGSPAHLMVRGSTADQVAVAIDDVPLNYADGAPFDLSDLPLSAVERLEVYRGATPAWLGPQAMGGALRVLLRQARETKAEVSGSMASYGTRQGELGLSWRGERQAALLGLRWLGTQGDFAYRQDPGTAFVAGDDKTQTRSNNDLSRLGGILAAETRLGRRWTGYLRWLGAGAELGVPGAALFPAHRARFEQQRQLVALQATRNGLREGERLLLSLHASGLWTQTDDRIGELGLAWHSKQRVAGVGAVAAWEGRLGRAGPVEVGGQLRAAAQGAAVDGTDLLRDTERPRSWRNHAALTAALPLHWGPVTLTPGGGAEWVSQRLLDARQYPFAWADVAEVQATPWHAALGAQWQAHADWVVHSSVRRAVRLPNLQELFGDSAVVRGNARLLPESSVAIDSGVNWQKRGDGWATGVDVRGHATWAEDLIQLVGLGSRQAIYQNIGRAKVLGAEVQLDGRAGPWRGQLGHTTLVTIDDSAQVAYRGKALPLWPRSRWSGRVAWQIPMVQDDLRASVWTAAQWQAGYYLDAANLVALPSRTLVSAGVRTDLPRWGVHIDLRVDNAADVPWYDLVGYPLPGRTAWLQVGWSGREESM